MRFDFPWFCTTQASFGESLGRAMLFVHIDSDRCFLRELKRIVGAMVIGLPLAIAIQNILTSYRRRYPPLYGFRIDTAFCRHVMPAFAQPGHLFRRLTLTRPDAISDPVPPLTELNVGLVRDTVDKYKFPIYIDVHHSLGI